jgi:hypothetical protein
MSFDMNQCKPGDKLISTHGVILTYVEKKEEPDFPHIVRYPEGEEFKGSLGSRTEEGYVFDKRRLPEDHDIIGFAPEESQMLNAIAMMSIGGK